MFRPPFPGFRPWSQQQPDQSSKCQLLEEQPRRNRQQHRSQTVDCFVEQIHLRASLPHRDRDLNRLLHTANLRCLRSYRRQSAAERRLFEKYARAVADGRFPNCKDAAPACRRELVRMYARVGKQSSLRVGRLAGRTLVTINRSICETAGRLGLQFPGRNWLPAEERIFDGWLRWYNRYHDVRRLRPLSQAGEGLSDDLAKQGFRRTPDACRVRLVVTRRRRLGL